MPYRGKPSGGCQICRQRKIKCDQTEGGCKNCARARFDCPGYRNPIDLLFLDESSKVVKKSKSTKTRRKPLVSRPAPSQLSNREESATSETSLKSNHDIDQSIRALVPKPRQRKPDLISTGSFLPDLDDVALAFCFSKYVVVQDVRKKWILDDGNGCLVASMRALGLAALSQRGNGPSCSFEARFKYTSAIRLVNEAIGSPNLAKQDSTLQAINILSIFEAITGFNRSLDSWRDHVTGAAALLQLRGSEQFDTETGGRLFIQASQTLAICCVQRHLPIPKHIWDMMHYAETCLPKPIGSGFLFHKATMRFADLYSRLQINHEPLVAADAEYIVHEALALEADFIYITAHAPKSWEFTVAFGSGATVFAGYYYVYRSALAAQMMNSMRSYRITLRDIIHKAVDQCTGLETLQLSQTEVENLFFPQISIHHLQQEILASIPQHLGATLSSSEPASIQTVDPSGGQVLWPNFYTHSHNPFSFRGSKSPDIPFVRMAGGYLLQWPLSTAGMASPPGSSLRLWVIDTLRFVGKSAGVKHALLLASKLEGNENQLKTIGSARFEAWKAKYAFPEPDSTCCSFEAPNIDQPVWSTFVS